MEHEALEGVRFPWWRADEANRQRTINGVDEVGDGDIGRREAVDWRPADWTEILRTSLVVESVPREPFVSSWDLCVDRAWLEGGE